MAIGSERVRRRGDEGAVVLRLPGIPPVRQHRQPTQVPAAPPAAPGGDAVTGLPGRAAFMDCVRGAARRRRDSENPWLAVASLEGLATVSDREGRQAAEELLRIVATDLRGSLREQDRLARIGDQAFGIVLDAPYGDEAMTPLGRLTARVKQSVAADQRWRGVALSIGISPLWSGAPERALREADDALERARRRGSGVAMSTALP